MPEHPMIETMASYASLFQQTEMEVGFKVLVVEARKAYI
jgi:hypothetical protein